MATRTMTWDCIETLALCWPTCECVHMYHSPILESKALWCQDPYLDSRQSPAPATWSHMGLEGLQGPRRQLCTQIKHMLKSNLLDPSFIRAISRSYTCLPPRDIWGVGRAKGFLENLKALPSEEKKKTLRKSSKCETIRYLAALVFTCLTIALGLYRF